jgi:transcriptional regulator with XRE-family HTH domain
MELHQNIKPKLGKTLKRKRLLKDLTRKELAPKIKVNPLQIFRWEQNKTVPDGNNLLLLMIELDISPADFFPAPTPPEPMCAPSPPCATCQVSQTTKG